MGNNNSILKPDVKKFGSINDPNNKRPGWYCNGKIIKYQTNQIQLVPGEDIGSFKKLKYGYAITNKRAFYKGESIIGVNPSHFGIINRQDVNQLNNPELVKLDSVLGIETFGNKRKIYHKGKLIL